MKKLENLRIYGRFTDRKKNIFSDFFLKNPFFTQFYLFFVLDIKSIKLRLISLMFPASKKYEKTRKLKKFWSFYRKKMWKKRKKKKALTGSNLAISTLRPNTGRNAGFSPGHSTKPDNQMACVLLDWCAYKFVFLRYNECVDLYCVLCKAILT